MQRQRNGLVPIGDVLSDLGGPIQAFNRDSFRQLGFGWSGKRNGSSMPPSLS